jgi:hypothetical protein
VSCPDGGRGCWSVADADATSFRVAATLTQSVGHVFSDACTDVDCRLSNVHEHFPN